MITLPGVTIHSKIYESLATLVYRGIREQENCGAIAKVLKQDYPSSGELTRYRQEYEITRSLNIEGVVKAYSQQDYQRTLVILLEDFGGESLEYWMRQQSDFCPMPLSVFLDVAIALTDTLGKIHAANVIHKDINPSNIVLNPKTGVVKMIDFGIATRFSRTNPTFKSLHLLEGTLAYLSPEQTGRMNRRLDYRTDFYSLGVTFYELLTGQLPFPTQDILELVHCHIARPPIPPHELNATIPKPISDLILKLMAKNAEDRYQSAWGIKADLERCAQQLAEVDRIESMQLGLQDVSEQFCIPQKLYGRAAEIEALLVAFDRVAGSEGVREMILVSGDAGVGKTALVQELYKPITAKHGYFIWGKFDQFRRNLPYSAIIDALQKLVQQLLGEPDEQMEVWRSRLLTALGSNGQVIIDVIPEVELIVGKQPPVPEVGATEAQNRFNLTFQKFVRVFCAKEHPLAIFLDDLQWIDAATLKLIELILLDEQTQYLFLIGAYRDNEVTPTHPLILTLESLRKQGAVLQEIILTPLTLESLSQLIAETLHHYPETVHFLAQTVSRKTEGNPFFVGEFLKLLYGENLLTFDVQQLSWQWNLAEIEAQDITDNVVELLLRQLQKLSEATQQILSIAACVGSEFYLETLAIVCEQSPQAISLNLLAAIQAELIQPLSELDENLLVQEYKFSHDRVQQAAYALIDESQKQAVHLQIGRNLLKKTLPEQLSERLFEIVDHLNHGIELVSDRAERDEIAKLNLLAGQKAKGSIAYSTARTYLTTGRQWLEVSSWQTNYDLTLELYVETTEVAYLCGNFEQVEFWFAIVLQEAKTVLDTVKVYEVKIQTYIAQSQPLKAINIALQVLKQLGICFLEKPSQSDIQLELDAITSLLSEKSIEDLSYLPQMSEPDKLAAMRILSKITVAAYFAAPNLMPLLVSKQVNLSIQYGNAFVSPFAYAFYGLILCGTVENIQSGYEFGQIALTLLSQPNTHSIKARTLNVVNYFIIHWKEYVRKILQPLLEPYQSGLETGDLEFAAYGVFSYCCQSFIVGKELVEVEREMRIYSEAIRQIKQEAAHTWTQIYQQTVLNLIGCSVNPTRLVGKSYDEENRLTQHDKDGFAIFLVYFNKLILCYLFSEYDRAVENSALASSYFIRITATPLKVPYYLYDSLARLAIYPGSSAQVQSEILKKVTHSQEKMKQWAHYAPMNYLHKYHLVEAEKARVLGQFFEAEEFYEQAIQGARDNEYIQEEALAYELAAKFYLARSREKIAQTYMKEAHYCYERWGATAKVKDLETRYPQFFPQSSGVAHTPIHTASETISTRLDSAFDLAAVLKASQTISSEIELERLLGSLMQILIENAGAQTGFLVLENSSEWVIEAACELNEGEQDCATRVLQSIPMANRLPESIIQYVIRTHETVILNDATREGNFINEPYIQHHQTQSLLCLPLLNQDKLVGVLYLENQVATGAFTPARSQVLHLLSTQAAIAIENARLYSRLRASESRMTQFLEAVPVGIAVMDASGRPCCFNQRAIQLVGKGTDPSVTLEQLAEAYQLYRAGTDQQYPTEELPIIQALSGERTTVNDLEIHQNSAIIPVEVWGTPIFDEQGNVAYALAAFQDITERRQAEQLLADYNRTLEQQVAERTAALQRSEAKFRNIFENSQVGIFRTRLSDGLILDANQRLVELFGFDSPDEIIGIKRTTDFYVNPVELHPHLGELQIFDKHVRNIEVQIRKRNGTLSWGLYSFRLNTADGYMECVIADISDRKQAEAALQNSEERLRLALTATNQGLYDLDLKTEERIVNSEYALMLGYDPATFHEPISEWIARLHPDDRESVVATYRAYIAGEIPSYQAEYRQRTQNGQWKWTLSVGKIVAWDESGQPMRMLGTHVDINDRKRAEEASILEERNHMAREIHDTLAQTFTGIIIHARSASNKVTVDPEKAQTLLTQILDLARSGLAEARRSVEALRRPYLLESSNLQAALSRLAAQLDSSIATQIVYEVIGTTYPLSSDLENNLFRIGQEAVTNAIKHAKAHEIRIELVYKPTQCSLRIKDDGQGFDVENQAMRNGFGLLGIAERAERIRAELKIQSHLGQGTEIVVSIDRE
ncbi:AAA family ATPase [Chroococcidiopsis sp. CCMEE 29]|uniref:AAA family ATPase n=1 Tax=Chroococcidiopsis sp. CCMEE 29 TaxID=155894 RepID=UPI0020227107|nr:AAA family ATPase [Chroococcidiopsis sp. CCMEE 29]